MPIFQLQIPDQSVSQCFANAHFCDTVFNVSTSGLKGKHTVEYDGSHMFVFALNSHREGHCDIFIELADM